jgi:hypothetical protein
MPSNTSIGRPPGLSAVFSISGGTASTSTDLRDPARAVAADVARHFAAAGREADQRRTALRSSAWITAARSSA